MSHKILSWKCFGKFGSLTFINELTLFKSNFLYFGTINSSLDSEMPERLAYQNDLHKRNLSSSALHKTSLHPNDDNFLQPISCLMTSSWRMTIYCNQFNDVVDWGFVEGRIASLINKRWEQVQLLVNLCYYTFLHLVNFVIILSYIF